MDIKRLKERKKELRYTNKDIAELSGVPLGTVQKVFGALKSRLKRPSDFCSAFEGSMPWKAAYSAGGISLTLKNV